MVLRPRCREPVSLSSLPPLRKHLSTPGLLESIRLSFAPIPDPRSGCPIPLVDALMSGLAVFSLKYPSLLKFDEAYQNEEVIRANLKSLYGVEHAPCDTQLRTRLDPIDPESLRPAFAAVHRQLQRGKALEDYTYWEGHYLVSIDGTGQYASSAIRCPECCIRNEGKANESYYHQLLAAVIIHPDLKTVLPFMPEAITRADGACKNDCERNAAKRLLSHLREDHPKLKMIVVEDSLASNGPHIKLLESLDIRYILGVKPGDHEALFEAVQERLCTDQCPEYSHIDEHGVEHGYRWVNGLSLNKAHPEQKVNFLEYWEIKNGQEKIWTWITDIPLTQDNVEAIMRAGRARWKIENETFNTLKNQGYHLEHNYGHGKKHLSTVFATLTVLAFLVDQVQELSCRLFQAARARFRSRTSLWERLRALFTDFFIPDWKTLWEVIAIGHAASVLTPKPNTS
ncbi:MAG: transposase [bacterium]|nr:transposase [Planctomycetota bacterium]MCP4934547.1 transposase [bacterium]